jgi:GMP synthase-like glutamine amidotransferase
VKALFIQHDHAGHTGAVGRRFAHHGFEIDEFLIVPEAQFFDPNVSVTFPDLNDYDVVIPLGAPWGAWDDACIGNWLSDEVRVIGDAVRAGKPVLGICFGAQVIARALGGDVSPAPVSEIGWTYIRSLEPELVSNGPWFQFHFDRFTVPPGARTVADNPAAPQAFVVGKTLGVQFHPELNSETLTEWFEWGGAGKVSEAGLDPEIMLQQTRDEEQAAEKRTYALVDAFLRDVAGLIS